MKKRLLLIGLILAMILACFTVSASAIGVSDGNKLKSFLEGKDRNIVYELGADISGSWVIKSGSSITIDLQGHNLTYADIGSKLKRVQS